MGCCWPRPGRLLWLLAGAGGLALLAYCLRFDQQRRSAPDFQRRLREKKKEHELAKEREIELRKLKDTAKAQDFFLQEIQLGELWLERGEQKKSIEHLANAIAVCTHPAQLIHVLEQTLPPHIFEMLARRVPSLMELESELKEEDVADE